ncbi:MAG TPA: DUF1361 domain-containing protein [Flavobacteriaceae bacterium]|nr:DUF1361 domain-containing protein [Flavobacteriaceae bacterium]
MKDLIFSRFKTLTFLFCSMALSIVLLMVRMKLTREFFLLFLVWNLFLAFIPFAISFYLQTKADLKKWQLVFSGLVWLLFLPNAPYIITDLFHLRHSTPQLIWLDILVIVSFAINGLILYLISVTDMRQLFQQHFQTKLINWSFSMLPFLVAFGIYLGRFLRYNSWDILHRPLQLLLDCLDYLLYPLSHLGMWLFTVAFGCLLLITTKVMEEKKAG